MIHSLFVEIIEEDTAHAARKASMLDVEVLVTPIITTMIIPNYHNHPYMNRFTGKTPST